MKKLISLQHCVTSHIQNRTKHFFWDNDCDSTISLHLQSTRRDPR